MPRPRKQLQLDGLRDKNLVTALEAIAAAAAPVAAELLAERMTAQERTALTETTASYRPLMGTLRGQVLAGTTLRPTGYNLVAHLRTAFEPIDTRMGSLGEGEKFVATAAEYRKVQMLVDGGRAQAG